VRWKRRGIRSSRSGWWIQRGQSVLPVRVFQADREIEYSIVLPRASIRGVRRIEASIIGHEVEVTPAPRVPKAHRLVLGDHSKVQISS
jgi:ADP-glucose pyrophosphorylase